MLIDAELGLNHLDTPGQRGLLTRPNNNASPGRLKATHKAIPPTQALDDRVEQLELNEVNAQLQWRLSHALNKLLELEFGFFDALFG